MKTLLLLPLIVGLASTIPTDLEAQDPEPDLLFGLRQAPLDGAEIVAEEEGDKDEIVEEDSAEDADKEEEEEEEDQELAEEEEEEEGVELVDSPKVVDVGEVTFEEDPLLRPSQDSDNDDDLENHPITVLITPLYVTTTRTRTLTKVKPVYQTCYKAEEGIEPCLNYYVPSNGAGGRRRRRKRRNFKVEVKPSGERVWNVEITPTRVSRQLGEEGKSQDLDVDIAAAVHDAAAAAGEDVGQGDPLFVEEEAMENHLTNTEVDEENLIGVDLQGGRNSDPRLFTREIIGLSKQCFNTIDGDDKPLISIISTRIYFAFSTVTTFTVSPDTQTVSFAKANACLPDNVDQMFTSSCI